jgi:hypothetical protein
VAPGRDIHKAVPRVKESEDGRLFVQVLVVAPG